MLTDAKVANNVISESVRFFVVVFNWNEQEFEFFSTSCFVVYVYV